MSYHFVATFAVSMVDEFDILHVGFADHQYDTKDHLMIQWMDEFDEQDRELGMDHIYTEIEDQGRSCYAGVRAVSVTGTTLTIEPNEEGARYMQLDGPITVELPDGDGTEEALASLERICAADDIPFSRS